MSTDPSSPRQTISDALKHFGETFPSLTVQEVKASWPKNMGEWLESIQKRNAQHKKRVKQMRKQFSITMELMRVEGVSVRKLTPPVLSDRFKDHVYLDIHGGAFVYYGGLSSIDEGILIAARLGIVVYSIDYRMPPAFPALFGLRDIEAVYRAFLSQENSKNILRFIQQWPINKPFTPESFHSSFDFLYEIYENEGKSPYFCEKTNEIFKIVQLELYNRFGDNLYK